MKLSKKHVSIFRLAVVSVETKVGEDGELDFVCAKPILLPQIHADRKAAAEWAKENVLKYILAEINAGEYGVPGMASRYDEHSGRIREPKDFDLTDFERSYPLSLGGTITLKSGQRTWIPCVLVRINRERLKLHNALQNPDIPMDCFWREGIPVR